MSDEYESQRSLLSLPPKIEGVEFAVSWRPIGRVSGDFYDFMIVEEDSVAIIVGDVSGKGYEAALLMAYTLGHIRVGLHERLRLPYIMASLDQSLKEHSLASKFVEILIGIYFLPLRRFVFVHGGSIVPTVVRAGRKATPFSRGSYPPLGFPFERGANHRFVEDAIDLERDDMLLIYSDGLGERVDESGKELVRKDNFGEVWEAPFLNAVLEGHAVRSAEDTLRLLIEFLDTLSEPRSDDETIVLLKAT